MLFSLSIQSNSSISYPYALIRFVSISQFIVLLSTVTSFFFIYIYKSHWNHMDDMAYAKKKERRREKFLSRYHWFQLNAFSFHSVAREREREIVYVFPLFRFSSCCSLFFHFGCVFLFSFLVWFLHYIFYFSFQFSFVNACDWK